MSDEHTNWLNVALGKDGNASPPLLGSERIKALIARALLTPASMSVVEIQELAASALAHLVRTKDPNRTR